MAMDQYPFARGHGFPEIRYSATIESRRVSGTIDERDTRRLHACPFGAAVRLQAEDMVDLAMGLFNVQEIADRDSVCDPVHLKPNRPLSRQHLKCRHGAALQEGQTGSAAC